MVNSPDFVSKLSNVERGQCLDGWPADTLQMHYFADSVHLYKLPFWYAAVFLKIIFLFMNLLPRMNVMFVLIRMTPVELQESRKITKWKKPCPQRNSNPRPSLSQLSNELPYPYSQILIPMSELFKVNFVSVDMYAYTIDR